MDEPQHGDDDEYGAHRDAGCHRRRSVPFPGPTDHEGDRTDDENEWKDQRARTDEPADAIVDGTPDGPRHIEPDRAAENDGQRDERQTEPVMRGALRHPGTGFRNIVRIGRGVAAAGLTLAPPGVATGVRAFPPPFPVARIRDFLRLIVARFVRHRVVAGAHGAGGVADSSCRRAEHSPDSSSDGPKGASGPFLGGHCRALCRTGLSRPGTAPLTAGGTGALGVSSCCSGATLGWHD